MGFEIKIFQVLNRKAGFANDEPLNAIPIIPWRADTENRHKIKITYPANPQPDKKPLLL
jgi:hypothetical protein